MDYANSTICTNLIGNGSADMWTPSEGSVNESGSTWMSITYDNHTNTDVGCKVYVFSVHTVVLGTFCVLGIIGHIISLKVFSADTQKTPTLFLNQCLSVSDMMLLFAGLTMYSVKALSEFVDGIPGYNYVIPYILVYGHHFAYTAHVLVIWITVLMGLNRYFAVKRPYQTRVSSMRAARKQVMAVLLFVLLYCIPKYCESRVDTVVVDNITYTVPMYNTMAQSKWYWMIYWNISYVVLMIASPIMSLVFFQFHMIRALRAFKQRYNYRRPGQSQRRANNITFVFAVILSVFIICQSPASITQIMWNALPDSSRECGGFQFYFSPLSNTLIMANSASGFFIHLLVNARFRAVLMKSLPGSSRSQLKLQPRVLPRGANKSFSKRRSSKVMTTTV